MFYRSQNANLYYTLCSAKKNYRIKIKIKISTDLTSVTIEVNSEVYWTSEQCDLFLGHVSFDREFKQIHFGSAPTNTCNSSWNAAGISDKLSNAYNLLWCGPNSPIIRKTWSNSMLVYHRSLSILFEFLLKLCHNAVT